MFELQEAMFSDDDPDKDDESDEEEEKEEKNDQTCSKVGPDRNEMELNTRLKLELNLCHKLKSSNIYIFATWFCKPLIL